MTSTRMRMLLATSAIVSGCLAGATGARAQAVEEITVTAQKRSERLQEVPVAVTAVTASTLSEQNLSSLNDYYARIPGLSFTSSAGLGAIALRGVTTSAGTSGSNPTVAITIDDVPFGSSSYAGYGSRLMPDLDPANLERIEVLRGPQGTLYGASSLGGLLKYVTKNPSTQQFAGRIEVGGMSVDHGSEGFTTRGSVNVPVVDGKAGVQVSGFYRRDPGFVDNTLAKVKDANSDHAYGGRVAFGFDPTDRISINLSAMSQEVKGRDSNTVDLKPDYMPTTGDLEHAAGPALSPFFTKARLFQGRVNVDVGFADLTSITAFGQNRYLTNTDATGRFGALLPRLGLAADSRVPLSNELRTNKFTEELRLASKNGEKIEWLVGLFLTHEQTAANQMLTAISPAGAFRANLYTGTIPSKFEEYAAFADVTYHFTEQFDVQVGGRFSRNRQQYTENDSGLLQGPPATLSSSSSENAPTWLVTPRYRFSPELMTYVRIATGYRPGGPNTGLPTIPKTFDSDTTTVYEAGIKGSLFNRALTYDAAAFWIEWDKIQLGQADPATQFAFFGNGKTARSRGLEASLQYSPWQGMLISANATYTDATLTADLPRGPTAAIFANSGDRLPLSAKFSGSLSADQDFPLFSNVTGTVGGTLTYVGQRYGDFPQAPGVARASAPSYTTLDLRGGLRYDAWTVNLVLRNVTDERGWTTVQLRSPGTTANGYSATLITPRTIGINLVRTF